MASAASAAPASKEPDTSPPGAKQDAVQSIAAIQEQIETITKLIEHNNLKIAQEETKIKEILKECGGDPKKRERRMPEIKRHMEAKARLETFNKQQSGKLGNLQEMFNSMKKAAKPAAAASAKPAAAASAKPASAASAKPASAASAKPAAAASAKPAAAAAVDGDDDDDATGASAAATGASAAATAAPAAATAAPAAAPAAAPSAKGGKRRKSTTRKQKGRRTSKKQNKNKKSRKQ
jgi:hypothetical protein